MKTGLYFGSFNPVHIGHLIVADTMIQEVGFDEVWLVVSPQNPFKSTDELAGEQHRKKMAELAAASHTAIRVCDEEFHLPRPSYTIDTLEVLAKKHPAREFRLIMGMDNLAGFHKWKNYDDILNMVKIEVYDRAEAGYVQKSILEHPGVTIHKFPLVNVSSTELRKKIAGGKSIRYWVLREVEDYILENGVYL